MNMNLPPFLRVNSWALLVLLLIIVLRFFEVPIPFLDLILGAMITYSVTRIVRLREEKAREKEAFKKVLLDELYMAGLTHLSVVVTELLRAGSLSDEQLERLRIADAQYLEFRQKYAQDVSALPEDFRVLMSELHSDI